MTVKIKKTYKYVKYLFGAYAFYSVINFFAKPINQDEQVLSSIDSLYSNPIETVHADIPPPATWGDGCACDGGGSSCE